MLYNIYDLCWDKELLELLDIPESILPKVCSSSEVYGHTRRSMFGEEIPISGICGDQQAALFGQACFEKGMIKNTYNTGCFILMNTGDTPVQSKNDLITTIAWGIGDKVTYALEGSVFIGGAVIQWLRDSLSLIHSIEEIESLALTEKDNGGVYIVPAFTGLGAPYWDQYARGTIVGLTRGSTSAHIARAALEGIAFQTRDVLKAMEADAGIEINELRVDGGAAINNLLMQFQSDVIDAPVYRPKTLETTALGAAYLAGLAVGYWDSVDEIKSQWAMDRKFEPEMAKDKSENLIKGWDKALGRSKDWDTEA
jgi:glycerol kinase